MEAYRQMINRRMVVSLVEGMIAFMLCIVVLLNVFAPAMRNEHYNSFVCGFQEGLSGSIAMVCFVQTYRYYKLLKDEEKMKVEKIKEEDERLQFIDAKTGGKPILWCAYVLIIVGTISAYFNMYVFATFIVCAMFLVFMKIILHVYYEKKY